MYLKIKSQLGDLTKDGTKKQATYKINILFLR